MKLHASFAAQPLSWVIVLLLWGASACELNADWPQWLGPRRDGIYRGKELSPVFPQQGPPVLWRQKVGEGFSAPVVKGDRLVLFHRLDGQETVECHDAINGRLLWSHSYPTMYVDSFGFDEGPRATPLIHEGKVYTFGVEGILLALDLDHGERLWQVDTQKKFGAPKGFFGLACSPMVEGRALMINLGGREGTGIVAFDKDQGDVLWKATDQAASYSSPASATIGGRRYSFFFNNEGLVALDPTNGHVFFQYPWKPSLQSSVNAATPQIVGDLIFLSTSYGKGATVLQFNEANPTVIWAKDGVLSNHYATSVHHDGFLYGFHGRQEQGCELRCVELRTGEIRWSHEGFKAGSVLLAGDHLWILTESGQLITAPATANGFQPTGMAQILGFSTRAYPALANGCFYARDQKQLVCVRVTRHLPVH